MNMVLARVALIALCEILVQLVPKASKFFAKKLQRKLVKEEI